MTDPELNLRERLTRLERAMPSAIPVDVEAVGRPARRRGPAAARWRMGGLLAAAVVAGILVGGTGLSLLSPGQPRTPVVPAGMHRSASPMGGPVCVAVDLPMHAAVERLSFTRVWWWPQGTSGCAQRSDFVYVQWVRPMRARITADDGSSHAGIVLELVVELRDGSRHAIGFTLDPRAPAADDGSVPTFRDALGREPGVPLLPIDSFDDIQEAP
jgi:hypothetical protein